MTLKSKLQSAAIGTPLALPEERSHTAQLVEWKAQRFQHLTKKKVRSQEEEQEFLDLARDASLATLKFEQLLRSQDEATRMAAIDWIDAALKVKPNALRAEILKQSLEYLKSSSLSMMPNGPKFRSLAGDRIEVAEVIINREPLARQETIEALKSAGLNGLAKIVAGRTL